MIHHVKGTTQTLTYRNKQTKYYLLSYLGVFRDNDRKAVFRLKQPLPTGQELVTFEVWECLNLDTGIKENKKVPVYLFYENTGEYVDQDRLDVIDDMQEVNSLLDHYDCWFTLKRDYKNFRTDLKNKIHQGQLDDLRRLDSSDIPIDFKKGVRLKLIQKENPNSLTRRDFREWQLSHPDYALKLMQYVYTNPSDYIIDNSSSDPQWVCDYRNGDYGHYGLPM